MPGLPVLRVEEWRGELGLEPTPEMFIAHLILCLREWRRCLRNDGTVWVNLGDSYAGGNYRGGGLDNASGKQRSNTGTTDFMARTMPTIPVGLKQKDLTGIPWRFAFAAQAEGWWLRSDIIGAKVAPMPESCKDRPTRSHEHIFLLAKSQTYYYDQEAVREPQAGKTANRYEYGFTTTEGKTGMADELCAISVKQTLQQDGQERFRYNPAGRNMRDVIEWRPQSFSGAHFATFPERIPEIAILAGTSARGCCPRCKAGYVRVVERIADERQPYKTEGAGVKANGAGRNDGKGLRKVLREDGKGGDLATKTSITTGWQPSCECFGHFEMQDLGHTDFEGEPVLTRVYVPHGEQPEPVPAVVLDPFVGSGTTLRVAARLGRHGIGVDVSENYLEEIVPQRMGSGIQMTMPI